MDPDNHVVRLCVRGMGAEARGEEDEARRLFLRAWEDASDDYEACVAAHYVARHQATPEDTLRWNQECLDRADRVGDERVRGFYASLYVNMGRAHRELGDMARAHAYFVRAAERVRDLPEGEYGVWNRFAIAEGLRETAGPSAAGDASGCREGTEPVSESPTGLLSGLLARLCARNELKALGLILPAYLGDLGTEEDRVRLRSALHMVHAARWLPADEQAVLGTAIAALAEEDRMSVAG
ncbi:MULTISPECIES: hypothetical protein [Streptomyces]|uniref:hypothetical protein n=1 Tax=Streptomyces TaxID=1883 RepID=UPI0002AC7586|nr:MULTISPECIES: hypothetical protein [Streptomyces]KEF08081.1 hypothetical protein DF17_07270 [Streptomyces rimosus]KEF20956.1 hypothetical protein DF18_06995 [Streptomyces rimosus]KUJ31197.1 hypothetical protein ADK46_25350 [Streptomyces rimosus subsp. rimosus]